MTRTRWLKLLVLSLIVCGALTGTALAASSPTVATLPATNVTSTSALLHGRVTPNGRHTQYFFSYGPTTAYGITTKAHSAGRGTKPVSVKRATSGLTPGTVYHYRITAVNASGQSVGADRTFTTKGHPPAAVVTGGPVNIHRAQATVTGTINPEGAPTAWVVQFGLSSSYGFQTFPQTLPAGTAPVPVSHQLLGVAPGKLFHYRIIAFHGSRTISAGADATFFTQPSRPAKARVAAHTSPSHDSRSPYRFTTNGSLKDANWIPAAERCTGNVGIRYYNGRRQLAFVLAPLGPDCRFTAPASFRHLHGHGPVRLRVRVHYRGTGYVAAETHTDHVTAG